MNNLPMMEVPVPNIEDVGLEYLGELLQERQNLKKIVEDCTTKIHELDQEIGGTLEGQELKTVVWNNYIVIRRYGGKPRPILDRVLLLEAGVTPQQLKAGTRYGESGKPGVTVRPITEVQKTESDQSTSERDMAGDQVGSIEDILREFGN